MSAVIDALARHAAAHPRRIALSDGRHDLDYRQTHAAVGALAAALRRDAPAGVALAIGNCPGWAIADLAALAADVPCVPLPEFFSESQQIHVITDAAPDEILTDRRALCEELLEKAGISFTHGSSVVAAGVMLTRLRLRTGASAALPSKTAKVTYTSGTTGTPKGVCLSAGAIDRVARSLATVCRLQPADRHLALLPLSTLLENVGGVYAPLIAGASCVLAPQRSVGMNGAEGTDPEAMLDALEAVAATTAIVTPQLLGAAVDVLDAGRQGPGALRFLAVGGAPVAPSLLERAAAAGLPAFEGYGLSECASVVTLNTPEHHRPGSVGRALPHASVSVAADGEVMAAGAAALGYCGMQWQPHAAWPTGDIGRLDADGFLYLTGRKKNVFITSYGRNVSPEWVETELTGSRAIAQAWVWGEARPWNAAVLTPAPGASPADVEAAVAAANRRLPDYARVRAWIESVQPFSAGAGELTPNGRLRRDSLLARYRARIDQLYEEDEQHVL